MSRYWRWLQAIRFRIGRAPLARVVLCAICLSALLLIVSRAAAGTALHLVPPAGFVDVFAPDAAERCVTPAMVGYAKSAGFVAAAVDVRCPGSEVQAQFAVRVDPLDQPVTEKYLERTIDHARRNAGNAARLEVREHGLVDIAGVRGARLVMDVSANGLQTRTLMYLIPDGSGVALLTYQTDVDHFQNYLARFEESAHATTGGRESSGRTSTSASIPAMIGSILGLFLLYKLIGRLRARDEKRAKRGS